MVELAQCRIVTGDVAALARFYADLLGAEVIMNDYYVEVPAGGPTIGFSRPHYTEYHDEPPACAGALAGTGELILDLATGDVDARARQVEGLDVDWVQRPTDQPWGARSFTFRDPEGHLVNVFSPIGDRR